MVVDLHALVALMPQQDKQQSEKNTNLVHR